ncbi:peptidase S8/S53 domain-containing protein [Nemania sp. FL0031]|nr:peptidase S8/S53 domain-containing protein [Nemania sp. FL0031]
MIRVAVLDTGIDLTHPLIKPFADRGQIPDCWDFINETENIVDTAGHGTFVSHVLFKTAPFVMLYPMRVFRNEHAEDNTAALVKKAIHHAVAQWDVHIISMSFSLNDDDDELRSEIESQTDKVLFFAAASNNRGGLTLKDIGFPAKIKGRVICVNSANYNGIRSEFSPRGRQGRANISAIGEGIEAAWPLFKSDTGTGLTALSGTSCSTPVVAGLAALILDVVTQTQKEERVRKPHALQQVRVMERILVKNMSRGYRGTKYNHLTPFEFFNRDPVELVKDINRTIETVDDD